MQKNIKLYFICILVCSTLSVVGQTIPIIPEPDTYLDLGEHFDYNSQLRVYTEFLDDEISQIISRFDGFLTDKRNVSLINSPASTAQLLILNDVDVENNEGYKLEITQQAITIRAKEAAGVLYALQSLKQVVLFSDNTTLPTLRIEDEPSFKWRGLLLDVSRHFFTVDEVKRLLDNMCFYKLNVLHLHLTDGDGWRIEIKAYPELTKTGAKGDRSNPDEVMFYTQEQMKEIIRYAQDRGIAVIPEIEAPGHCGAALRSYSELKCSEDDPGYVFCAGKETTYEFLDNVLAEVAQVFPSGYIHIGGDEAWKAPWEKCPHCQEKIATEGLKNTDELQSYFVKRLEKILLSKGKKLIGWGEIREGGLAKTATVQSWRGVGAALEAASLGHDVIMSSKYSFYFDKAQSENRYTEPPAWRQTVSLKKTYEEEIAHEAIPTNLRHHVIGGEGTLWSERLGSEGKMQYQLFPRGIALSENLWSKRSNRDFEMFARKLTHHLDYLKTEGINYRFPAPVDIVNINGKVKLEAELPFVEIRYTTDGSTPDMTSKVYRGPIEVSKPKLLKASVVWDDICSRPDAEMIADYIPRTHYKIIKCTSENSRNPIEYSIDPGNLRFDLPGKSYPTWNFWLSDPKDALPIELVIDLGQLESVSGFVYKPRNDGVAGRIIEGNILEYQVFVGDELDQLNHSVLTGKFSGESKTEFVQFGTVASRYVKLVVTKGVGDRVNIADLQFFR